MPPIFRRSKTRERLMRLPSRRQRAAHHDQQYEQVDNQLLRPGELAVADFTNHNVRKGDRGDKDQNETRNDFLELGNASHDLFVGFHEIIPFLVLLRSSKLSASAPGSFSPCARCSRDARAPTAPQKIMNFPLTWTSITCAPDNINQATNSERQFQTSRFLHPKQYTTRCPGILYGSRSPA